VGSLQQQQQQHLEPSVPGTVTNPMQPLQRLIRDAASPLVMTHLASMLALYSAA
jgi:hypothetical protein